MKYKVTMNIDATVDVIVDADSPREAFENASVSDANVRSIDDVDVFASEPVGCEDENGNYTRYTA